MTTLHEEVVILIGEDDHGHARLIEKNLERAGLRNRRLRFSDGQEILDFFFPRGGNPVFPDPTPCLLLLDIRMPRVDGIEVLRRLKQDTSLKTMPVIMLTTTEDPREIALCHEMGCNNYIVKPVDYGKFAEAIHRLGDFIGLARIPPIPPERPHGEHQ